MWVMVTQTLSSIPRLPAWGTGLLKERERMKKFNVLRKFDKLERDVYETTDRLSEKLNDLVSSLGLAVDYDAPKYVYKKKGKNEKE